MLTVTACGKKDPLAYLYTDLTAYAQQKQLVCLLRQENDIHIQFAIIDKIAHNLQAEKKIKTLTIFLQSLIEQSPHNMYNAQFVLRLASAYHAIGHAELAAYYFDYVLTNYPDISIKGKSAHLICLKKLIEITPVAEKKIDCYLQLLTHFYDDIDPAYVYFMLAQAYEKQGEWQLAIQTYMQFLEMHRFDVIIPGILDSYGYARKIVDYNDSAKSWTFDTLDELVKTVSAAIRRNDYPTLEKCRSKVNFFAMSWKQEMPDSHQNDFNLKNFMHGRGIKIAPAIDASSTPYEAYLRTSGWNQYIRTWYLYFKKINFPADPSIHGRWEWAGIYYGEKI